MSKFEEEINKPHGIPPGNSGSDGVQKTANKRKGINPIIILVIAMGFIMLISGIVSFLLML
jgi:hypothetical protein